MENKKVISVREQTCFGTMLSQERDTTYWEIGASKNHVCFIPDLIGNLEGRGKTAFRLGGLNDIGF